MRSMRWRHHLAMIGCLVLLPWSSHANDEITAALPGGATMEFV